MKTKTAVLNGKPDAGNPHDEFDEGVVASAKPRRRSLLYKWVANAARMMSGVMAAVISTSGAFADTTPMQELYPFDIVGRIVNADNVAYDATSGILIVATDKDGRRLAAAEVVTPGTLSPWNFVLSIPLASKSVSGYAAKGDVVRLTAKMGDSTYAATLDLGEQTVGNPGDAVCLRVMFAEDANDNGIADSYEEAILDQLWAEGRAVDEFDAEADYDGDKMSNRDEYLAGTDPLLKSDFFAAKQIATESDAFFALTFEANAGRTYSVKDSGDLSVWTRMGFRLTPDPAATPVDYISNSSREWTTRTIYLLKEGASHFYRLHLNDEQLELDK